MIPPCAGFFMKYFKREEFIRNGISWFEQMDLELLEFLDEFRHHWGKRVFVSKHPWAVGRQLGPAEHSLHNFDRWGLVKACDVMPEGMDDAVSAIEADRIARHVGFGGIGLYPYWMTGGKMTPGLHLDVRPLVNSARWGAIKEDNKQKYVSFEKAVMKMGDTWTG